MMTPLEKLKAFTVALVTLNYSQHTLFETFLVEWEYKIDTKTCEVEELYLFNKDQDIMVTHPFEGELRRKYYEYFRNIGIVNV